MNLRHTLSTLFVLATIFGLRAQTILEDYVDLAIRNHPLVREKLAMEEKQQYALSHARKLAGPDLKFLTQYTVAHGGRSIDLPIGSLLNGVYSTLDSIAGRNIFPRLENETISFLPNHFYDARFRLTLPLLRPEIKYNRLIKEQELELAELQTAETLREIKFNVKTAYMHWMQARQAVVIYEQGIGLLTENRRIADGLVQNGMALPSAVLRIDAELEKVSAQMQKAETDLRNAAAWLNIWLGRQEDATIMPDHTLGVPDVPVSANIAAREELLQLQTGMRLQELAGAVEKKQLSPTLGLQIEAGSQAFVPDWGGYYLGGVQLEIPIWDNRKSRLKQQEWHAQQAATSARYEWTQKALEVQWQTAVHNLVAEMAMYNSYSSQVNVNQRLYQETVRRYREGMANYIELLDARTQLTQAQLEQNLALYQAWIRRIEVERYAPE
jgi:hypothetical protein